MHKLTCCECKSDMWLPPALYEASKASENINFYCPYGHIQHFPKGDSALDKMRRERDWAKQELAYKDDLIRIEQGRTEAARNQAKAYKASATKARARGAASVCQCCNRIFPNDKMARHMKTKHADFKAEAVA